MSRHPGKCESTYRRKRVEVDPERQLEINRLYYDENLSKTEVRKRTGCSEVVFDRHFLPRAEYEAKKNLFMGTMTTAAN